MNEYQENLAMKGRLSSGNLANSLVLIAEDEASKVKPQFKAYPIDSHKWSDIDQACVVCTNEIQIMVGGNEGYLDKSDAIAIAKHFNLIPKVVDND